LGASHLIKETTGAVSFAFEPEGILSTFPCWAHVLLGAYVGSLITGVPNNRERVRKIALTGIVLLFTGFPLQYLDPINKKLWTSSYTLVTCGTAALLLALLINIIDIQKKKRWSHFFEVFGVNPLFMYVVAWIASVLFSLSFIPCNGRLISIRGVLYNQTFLPLLGNQLASLAFALFFIVFIWALGYILYRKHIYIKL
jgi:predicted acyltransferase